MKFEILKKNHKIQNRKKKFKNSRQEKNSKIQNRKKN